MFNSYNLFKEDRYNVVNNVKYENYNKFINQDEREKISNKFVKLKNELILQDDFDENKEIICFNCGKIYHITEFIVKSNIEVYVETLPLTNEQIKKLDEDIEHCIEKRKKLLGMNREQAIDDINEFFIERHGVTKKQYYIKLGNPVYKKFIKLNTKKSCNRCSSNVYHIEKEK